MRLFDSFTGGVTEISNIAICWGTESRTNPLPYAQPRAEREISDRRRRTPRPTIMDSIKIGSGNRGKAYPIRFVNTPPDSNSLVRVSQKLEERGDRSGGILYWRGLITVTGSPDGLTTIVPAHGAARVKFVFDVKPVESILRYTSRRWWWLVGITLFTSSRTAACAFLHLSMGLSR